MDTETSTRFKAEVKPHLEAAIVANGGIERVRKIYGMMGGVVDFLSGWIAGGVIVDRRNKAIGIVRAARGEPELPEDLSHEEIRRIYDLVRLRLDSESTTS